VIVGTPGTVKRWVTKGYLDPDSINIFVLDEADKMVEEKALGKNKQFFTALCLSFMLLFFEFVAW